MRLIDAEKIHWEYKCISKEEIDDEPTVEAIPIEFLENWKRGKTSIEQVVADKIMMDYKYRNWEKENEKLKQKNRQMP